MKNFTLLILFLASIASAVNGQEELQKNQFRIDSLKEQITVLPDDTMKLLALEELQYAYLNNLQDSLSIIVGEQFYSLARQLNDDEGLSLYYTDMIIYYFFFDEDLFKNKLQEGTTYFQAQKDSIGLIHLKLTEAYYLSENYKIEEAIVLLEEAIEQSKEKEYPEGEILAYDVLLGLMDYMDKWEQVLIYANKILSMDTPNNSYIGIASFYKGASLAKFNRLDSVPIFFYQALNNFLEEGNNLYIQRTYHEFGKYFFKLDNIEKAKYYIHKVESLLKLSDFPNAGLSRDYGVIGSYYFQNQQLDSAKYYLEKSMKQAKVEENNTIPVLVDADLREMLSTIYEQEGNYEKALKYFKLFHLYGDSLANRDTKKKVEEFNIKYETRAKQQAIELLTARNQTYLIAATGTAFLTLLIAVFFLNLRRKNRKITQQKAQLEQLNTTKDRLFAIISHDLRKPALAFRGISKKVKFLIQRKEYQTLDQYGASIEKAAFSLNSLLDNLLNWALQQREVLPYKPSTIKVAEVTQEICDLFHQMANDKNIDLQLAIPATTVIFADPNAYSTIVRNLLDNAIKYTPEGGRIDLTTESVAEGIALKVSDTGIGIPKTKTAQLFDLQRNKSQQGTAGEMGSGLGLTLVKDLVALNKGIIRVESKKAIGTTFEVVLPAA